MTAKREPVVVMPVVYWLPINMWRWCKLSDICETATRVAKLAGNIYHPSPEQLVREFAALVRPNRLPEHLQSTGTEKKKKKIFRYSMDGESVWGIEVPSEGSTRKDPPYEPFMLLPPANPEMFVPEGWARDTLRAIMAGAVSAADWGERCVGFRPEDKRKDGGVIEIERFTGARSL